MDRREVAGADQDVDFPASFNEQLSRGCVTVQIAEEEEFHLSDI